MGEGGGVERVTRLGSIIDIHRIEVYMVSIDYLVKNRKNRVLFVKRT